MIELRDALINWADSMVGTRGSATIDEGCRRAEFARRISYARTQSERFEAILGYYRALWPTMKKTPCHRWAIDHHEIEWPMYFSPIEDSLWFDIRAEGLVLYPQHPIAGFFVDFGHPVARVAIECDGKQFHQDLRKDRERQRAIEAKGWTVYRLSGRQCLKEFSEEENFDTWEFEPDTRKVLVDIARKHRLSPMHLTDGAFGDEQVQP